MSTSTDNSPVEAAVDALQVAEDTLAIAREAETQKSAAESRAKEAEDKLVELQKVASEHEKAVDDIVKFLGTEGYIATDNQEKFACEMKADPSMAVDLFKRIVSFSASSYNEGEGIPKAASAEVIEDPEAQERALWLKMAEEGA